MFNIIMNELLRLDVISNGNNLKQKIINKMMDDIRMTINNDYVDMKTKSCELSSLFVTNDPCSLSKQIQINNMVDNIIYKCESKELCIYTKKLISLIIKDEKNAEHVNNILTQCNNKAKININEYYELINNLTKNELLTNDRLIKYIYNNFINKRQLKIAVIYLNIVYLIQNQQECLLIAELCNRIINTFNVLKFYDLEEPMCQYCIVKHCFIYLINCIKNQTNKHIYHQICNDLIETISSIIFCFNLFDIKRILWCIWIIFHFKIIDDWLNVFFKQLYYQIINFVKKDSLLWSNTTLNIQSITNKYIDVCAILK